MRFRSKGQPKGQMLAREQRRLTFIIAGAGLLVLLLIISGRSPWLTGLFSDPPAANPKPPAVAESLLSENALRPDEIEFVPSESSAAKDYASMIDRTGTARMEGSGSDNATSGDEFAAEADSNNSR